MHVELAGIALGDHGERAAGALVALDGDDARGTLQQQCARQPAGAWPDLDHRAPVQHAGGARDAPRQVEVEDEILAQALLGAQVEGADHLAQRRQAVGTGAGGSLSLARAHDGARHGARRGDGGGHLQGLDEAARRCSPLSRDVERGAVIG